MLKLLDYVKKEIDSFQTTSSFSYYSPSLNPLYVVSVVIVIVIVAHFMFFKRDELRICLQTQASAQAVLQAIARAVALAVAQAVAQTVAQAVAKAVAYAIAQAVAYAIAQAVAYLECCKKFH